MKYILSILTIVFLASCNSSNVVEVENKTIENDETNLENTEVENEIEVIEIENTETEVKAEDDWSGDTSTWATWEAY